MEKLFLHILDLSIAASWVILAVLAVRMLLRKAPKVYSYALWAAVGFRLISSASISSVVSLFNLRPFKEAAQTTGELQFIPQNIENAVIPPINTGIPAVDTVINPGTTVVDDVVNTQLPTVTPQASVNPIQILILAGMIIWLVGIAVMVTVSTVNYIRLRKGLRFAVRMEGNIWQCETVRSPFLLGMVNPKIYLPYGLDSQTQAYILAHEKYHLKRCDHIVKLLAYTLLTIHWFNPLCHLAFRLMNRDMEMSCDEKVLAQNNIPTAQYSLSLLTIATNRRFQAATPLAFAETGVKERMINVLNWKKPKKWVTVVAVMVCAILLISCATNPKVNDTTGDDPAVDTTIGNDPTEDTAADPTIGNDPTEDTAVDPIELDTRSMLELPGMKWGATPEEVKGALNLPEESYLVDGQLADIVRMIVAEDFTFFGEEVAYGRFLFLKHPWIQDWALDKVELYYKDETDMVAVKDAMTELYGAPNEDPGFTRYKISHGAVEAYTALGFSASGVGEGVVTNWWQSTAKRAHVLSADVVEKMIASGIVDNSGLGTGLDTTDPSSRDVVLEYLRKDPAVLAYCTNVKKSNNTHLPQYTTQNAVVFDAGVSVWAQQYFQLNYVGYTYVKNTKLLEFPRVQWGATVDEVKQALNITEEQISTDDYLEATNFDEHLLHVKDITFFGEKVSIGCFKFRSMDEEKLGLSYVMLFLDEDTDMEKLQAALSYYYNNQGTGEYFDTCKWEIKDEVNYDPDPYLKVEYELVEGRSRGGDAELWWLAEHPGSGASGQKLREAVLKVIEDPEFKTYNWVSPVKATEVIAPEGLDALKEGYESGGIDPALTEKWLEKRPLVWMSITNRSLQATRAEVEGIMEGELALATHNLVILDAQMLIELQYETWRMQKILESE